MFENKGTFFIFLVLLIIVGGMFYITLTYTSDSVTPKYYDPNSISTTTLKTTTINGIKVYNPSDRSVGGYSVSGVSEQYLTSLCQFIRDGGHKNYTDSFFNKTWYYSSSTGTCYYLEYATID